MSQDPEQTTLEFSLEETGQIPAGEVLRGFDTSAPGIMISMLPGEKALTGQRIDLGDRIKSFTYKDSTKEADTCDLTLYNGDLAIFEGAYENIFLPGTLLEVVWGYPGRTSAPRRMIIKKINGWEELKVTAQALSTQMDRKTKTRSWSNVKRSDVVREIAQEHGYGAEAQIEETADIIDTISQGKQTDARFLAAQAQREGFVFYVDDTGFHWHRRDKAAAPTHTLRWRGESYPGIKSISLSSDLRRRPNKVVLKGQDPKTGKEFTVTADGSEDRDVLGEIGIIGDELDTRLLIRGRESEGSGAVDDIISNSMAGSSLFEAVAPRNDTSVEDTTSAPDPKRAQAEADARFRLSEDTIKFALATVGDPILRAKTIIELLGVTKRWSGNYYVEEAQHSITGGEYTTSLKLIRDGTGSYGRQLGPQPAGGKLNDQKGPGQTGESQQRGPFEIGIIDDEDGEFSLSWREGTVPRASQDGEQ